MVGGRYIFPIKMLPIISDLRSGKPSFKSEGNWNLIAYDMKKKKDTFNSGQVDAIISSPTGWTREQR